MASPGNDNAANSLDPPAGSSSSSSDNSSPARKRPRRVRSPPTQSSQYSITLQNRYSLLMDRDDDDNDNNPEPTNQIKIPPIFVHNADNYQALINDIEKLLTNNFTTQIRGDKIKVITISIEDFRKLTKFFDDNNVRYHTFLAPDEKRLSVIIRSIPISYTDEEIFDELNEHYPVRRVTRLLNRDKFPMPLCAVELDDDEIGQSIFELERFKHAIIEVEPRKKSKEIPQCINCQRFGHTKNYCKLDPRCVKCREYHHFSKCTKTANAPPLCVNCDGEHPANYRGCPYYKLHE